MKYFLSLVLLLCCLCANTRERVFKISKGKETTRVTVYEKHENGLFSYTFDYGDSKTTKTVDSRYHSISWEIDAPAESTLITVAIKGDVFHVDGTYKGKGIHKVIKKDGNAEWMQGMGYCGGHLLRPGQTYEYVSISLHDFKTHCMRAVYIGEELRDGVKAYHFCMSPTGALSKFWKAHYYYDIETGDLVGQQAVEGIPGAPETVWTLEK